MSRAWDGRLGRTAIAVVVAVVVMVAGIALYFILEHGSGSSSPPLHDDGPTFYAALAEVNSSVVNVTGGPWALFSVYGIAAEEPFSAGVIAYPLNNITTNSCGAAFNGITLWNGSMPVFNGTFNSGSAPFWQFGYFSGTSQEFLLATSVDGRGHVYPPIPYPSSCQPWYDFPNTPTNPESISAWTSLLDPLPPNSPFGAQRVAQVLQTEGVSLDGRFAEIMTLGPGVFTGFGDGGGGWGVYFDRCGLPATPGWQPLVQAGVSNNGSEYSVENLTHNCAVVASGHGGLDGQYAVVFGSPSTLPVRGGSQFGLPFQVALADPNGTLTHDYDGWGLATWMIAMNLSSNGGGLLPLGSPTCPQWVASVQDCVANESGWFAVLTSATGQWLGAYGASPNGTEWTLPVWTVVSHQQIVIVVPSSWNVSGDSLSLASTTGASVIQGSPAL